MEKNRGIQYFPIALFASVMGFAGVTTAMRHTENLYGWNHYLSLALLTATSLLFILNLGILMYRLAFHRLEVKRDFNHPVKMNFFAAISISLLLLAVGYMDISPNISFLLWGIGAILQLTLTLAILSSLIWKHQFQIAHFNPTWFIPIVGNIVVPLAGSSHVNDSINWFFFSIGIFFSIIYMTLMFNRAFFHESLPSKLLPTYFILMAPPAIGFVSYMKLAKSLDIFGHILFGTAFFIGLLFLFQLKRFFSTPFALTWWAFLFPSAAITIATHVMYVETGNPFYLWVFNIQIVGLVGLALYLLAKTILMAKRGDLCMED